MKKQIEPWDEIAGLIALEKKAALDDFHRLEFVPTPLPTHRQGVVLALRPARRRALLALAASILFAAGLMSLWLLKGSWGSSSSAPALAALLSDSYFYSRAGSAEIAAPATVPPPAVSPNITAWVEAGLGRTTTAAEPVDPLAPIERGDPVEVRRKLSRVIRENTLERMLAQFREIHNKEA